MSVLGTLRLFFVSVRAFCSGVGSSRKPSHRQPRRTSTVGAVRGPNAMKRDRAAAKAKTKTVAAKSTLFVNGIPFSATKHDIASHFSSAAQCDAEALLPRVRQIIKEGKFKGTAFVDMTDWASVDRGLALHGKKMVCADCSTNPKWGGKGRGYMSIGHTKGSIMCHNRYNDRKAATAGGK